MLIAHLRGELPARDLLRQHATAGTAYTSVICRTEIEGGMRSGERGDVARLFEALEVPAVTDAVARRVLPRVRGGRA